ncbi:hypothetical protein T4B_13271 [Trichinella pseudospiralis]|uniref:Uncharacterized protein n=2 Tax=Trichinella pseudospiralis TaxID=6337 RepID=A0A0V1F433_TRIPS|nr:hypothetical protein T4D_14202 [Trichinella pseudospiralis]KRZ00605.1 hypothetical protein T4B_13271 [Trichinella pseudospiralis]
MELEVTRQHIYHVQLLLKNGNELYLHSPNFVVKIGSGTGKTGTQNLEETAPEMTKRLHNS